MTYHASLEGNPEGTEFGTSDCDGQGRLQARVFVSELHICRNGCLGMSSTLSVLLLKSLPLLLSSLSGYSFRLSFPTMCERLHSRWSSSYVSANSRLGIEAVTRHVSSDCCCSHWFRAVRTRQGAHRSSAACVRGCDARVCDEGRQRESTMKHECLWAGTARDQGLLHQGDSARDLESRGAPPPCFRRCSDAVCAGRPRRTVHGWPGSDMSQCTTEHSFLESFAKKVYWMFRPEAGIC